MIMIITVVVKHRFKYICLTLWSAASGRSCRAVGFRQVFVPFTDFSSLRFMRLPWSTLSPLRANTPTHLYTAVILLEERGLSLVMQVIGYYKQACDSLGRGGETFVLQVSDQLYICHVFMCFLQGIKSNFWWWKTMQHSYDRWNYLIL